MGETRNLLYTESARELINIEAKLHMDQRFANINFEKIGSDVTKYMIRIHIMDIGNKMGFSLKEVNNYTDYIYDQLCTDLPSKYDKVYDMPYKFLHGFSKDHQKQCRKYISQYGLAKLIQEEKNKWNSLSNKLEGRVINKFGEDLNQLFDR